MALNLSHVGCIGLSCLILVASLAHPSLGDSGSGSKSAISDLNSVNVAEKVTLDLYYETLCPFSARFISQQLSHMFDNDLIDIVTLHLVPWGNAILKSNKTFECQHGPSECLLNTVHACALALAPTVNGHFPFIRCVEDLVNESNYTQWNTCLKTLLVNPQLVLDCSSSKIGANLELKYASQTASLQPPHTYVPWVVVNGQPLYEDYGNFTRYVCKAYKGTPPSACQGISFHNAPNYAKAKANQITSINNVIAL